MAFEECYIFVITSIFDDYRLWFQLTKQEIEIRVLQ